MKRSPSGKAMLNRMVRKYLQYKQKSNPNYSVEDARRQVKIKIGALRLPRKKFKRSVKKVKRASPVKRRIGGKPVFGPQKLHPYQKIVHGLAKYKNNIFGNCNWQDVISHYGYKGNLAMQHKVANQLENGTFWDEEFDRRRMKCAHMPFAHYDSPSSYNEGFYETNHTPSSQYYTPVFLDTPTSEENRNFKKKRSLKKKRSPKKKRTPKKKKSPSAAFLKFIEQTEYHPWFNKYYKIPLAGIQ